MLFLACTEHTSTTSPVNETWDYDYQHQGKGADQIWSFRDDMCRIESQKAMKCVPFAINVIICLCEMPFLTCTEHTSTTLPVNETQDYDCQQQDKRTDQIWNFYNYTYPIPSELLQ